VMRRELDMPPERETEALYEDILAGRIARRGPPPRAEKKVLEPQRPPDRALRSSFVGRAAELGILREHVARAAERSGGAILLSGDAGIGKTRLVAEMAAEATRERATVMVGARRAHANDLPYRRLIVAIDGFVANRSRVERHKLARAYPAFHPITWAAPLTDRSR